MIELSPFVSIDASKAKDIFDIERPSFYYTTNEGKRVDLKEDCVDCNIITFPSNNSEWEISQNDLSITWRLSAKDTLPKLFKGDSYVCAAPGTTLGIAIQWFSKSSRQRGTKHAGIITSSSQELTIDACLTLPKATLRGSVSFVLVLYVVGISDDYDKYPQFASEIGSIIGSISEVYTVILDGNGSELTVYTEYAPGKPLWRLECSMEDPEFDLVEDSVKVYFNKYEQKAFEMIQPDSPSFNKYLQKEIYAEILIELIERVREKDNFYCISSAQEGSIGQLIRYHIDVNKIDITDISSVSRSVREFMYKK